MSQTVNGSPAAVSPDWDKWRPVIDKQIEALELVAQVTGNPWGEAVAAAVRAIFEKFFRTVHMGPVSAGAVARAAEAEALPSWVIPLISQIVQLLLSLRKSS